MGGVVDWSAADDWDVAEHICRGGLVDPVAVRRWNLMTRDEQLLATYKAGERNMTKVLNQRCPNGHPTGAANPCGLGICVIAEMQKAKGGREMVSESCRWCGTFAPESRVGVGDVQYHPKCAAQFIARHSGGSFFSDLREAIVGDAQQILERLVSERDRARHLATECDGLMATANNLQVKIDALTAERDRLRKGLEEIARDVETEDADPYCCVPLARGIAARIRALLT